MSECIVRMEMPKNCFECPFSIIDDTADGQWCNALGKQVYWDRDKDCPIICSLPEGHGRLVDEHAIKLPKGFFEKVDNVPKFYEWLNSLPTIVPAEAERSET